MERVANTPRNSKTLNPDMNNQLFYSCVLGPRDSLDKLDRFRNQSCIVRKPINTSSILRKRLLSRDESPEKLGSCRKTVAALSQSRRKDEGLGTFDFRVCRGQG